MNRAIEELIKYIEKQEGIETAMKDALSAIIFVGASHENENARYIAKHLAAAYKNFCLK